MSLLENRLAYASDAVAEIKSFLLSDSLHWNLGRRRSLSLGGLQLAMHELPALAEQMSKEQAAAYATIRAQLESVAARWESAWNAKARRELRNRWQLWGAYLRDLSEGSEVIEDYREQVRNRAIADLLSESAAMEDQRRSAMDEWLKANFSPGAFIWESQLQNRYPPARFWYLYGSAAV